MEERNLDREITEKLNLLMLERDDTLYMIQNSTKHDLQEQAEFYDKEFKEIRDLTRKSKQDKIHRGIHIDEIKEWDEGIRKQKRTEEEVYQELRNVLDEIAQDEKREIEQDKQLELEKLKLTAQPATPAVRNENTMKLPKLTISKFKGNHLDWFRFWSQYEAGVENADCSQVAKFSHLKELLPNKVRLLVDGLPLTTEGYERAKNILRAKYGQTSEVVNAHVQKIINLPTITGTNPNKIYEFYEILFSSVQTLESLGKVHELKGYVRTTLDKLVHLRSHLVQFDDDWKDWEFGDLVESLRKWTDRNPAIQSAEAPKPFEKRREPNLQTVDQRENSGRTNQQRKCVYCESTEHKAADCTDATTIEERKQILTAKNLCFNCTGSRHKSRNCRSQATCQYCQGKHHSSICPKRSEVEKEPMMAASETDVIYPTIVVKVNGVKCRALLDTASGSDYASSALIKTAKLEKVDTKHKEIEMMFGKVVKDVGIHEAKLTSTNGKFTLPIKVSEVNKPELLSVKNPKLAEILKKYNHLNGVTTNEYATKEELPIHLVLGTGTYSNIRTATAPRVGEVNEPNAEYTKLGWVIMSPGKESDVSHVYQTSAHPICDFEQLCRLDVLGLQDEAQPTEDKVLQRFRSQLSRDENGRYETDLLWKETKKPLKSNEKGSIARLRNTRKQLDRDLELKEECGKIIQQQLSEGIIEKVTDDTPCDEAGPICYLPCRPVVRKTATTTKTRLVFDASATENRDCASLNESIEVGPPMQNLLWDIVIRNRFYPVAVLGDMKQAFLQITIREASRDALRFHWFDHETGEIAIYRFCRLPFGLGEAPFILGGTVKEHLNSEKSAGIAPVETLEKIDEEIFMDDLTSGEFTIEDAKKAENSSH